jgi:hypothetical protein
MTTLAEHMRMIRAAIRAARIEGAPELEVTFGDGSIVRIPLTSEGDKALIADTEAFDL